MVFPKLSALLLALGALSGIQAGPVPNAEAMPLQAIAVSPPVHEIEMRALPPCEQRWPVLPKPFPTWTDAERKAQLQVDIDAVKGFDWRPSVCGIALWNCV